MSFREGTDVRIVKRTDKIEIQIITESVFIKCAKDMRLLLLVDRTHSCSRMRKCRHHS